MLSETGRRSLQDIEAFFKDSAHKYALSYCALIPIFTVVIVIYAISNPSAFVDFSPTFFLVVFLPLGIILTITTAWYVSQIKATYRKKRDLILIALQENRITLRPLPPPFRIEGFKGIKFRRPPNLLYACGVCGKYEATPASPKQCPICFILLCKIHDCHHRT